MNVPERNRMEELMGTLKSFLNKRPNPQSERLIDQYVMELEGILDGFLSGGYEASKIATLLTTSLRDGDNGGGYINHSCELSAANNFSRVFPNEFRYQVSNLSLSNPYPNTGSTKNFDFSFVFDGVYTFNVEVKTFSSTSPNDKALPVKLFLPQPLTKALYYKGLKFNRNCMPTIGRFLKDANLQLARPAIGLSVVLLCCNDLDEYADALTCFIGPHGIVHRVEEKDKIVPAPTELPNIDAVVVCNLGFGHQVILDSQKLKDFYGDESVELSDGATPWRYEYSLPVGFFLRNEQRSEGLLKSFMTAFQSNNLLIDRLMKENGGDIQQAVFDLFNSAKGI